MGFLNLSPVAFPLYDLPIREIGREPQNDECSQTAKNLKDEDLDCIRWLAEDLEQDGGSTNLVSQ